MRLPGAGMVALASIVVGGAMLAGPGPVAAGIVLLAVGAAIGVYSYVSNPRAVSDPLDVDDPAEPEAQPPRPPLTGSVSIGGKDWVVREEKRSGPGAQLLILTDPEDAASVMHVRPRPGDEADSLREVEFQAAAPSYRWFTDDEGRRWQVRLVAYTEENNREVQLVKFISDGDVAEGRYTLMGGLGLRSVDELRSLLRSVREADGGQPR